MKILIDFTQITVKKTGIGVYAFNLISKIYELDTQNIYYILIQDDDCSLNFINNPRFNIVKINSKIFRKLVVRFVLQQFYIPCLVLKYKIDITHSLHYSFPLLSPAKKIVTIPDMTFFKFPQYHILVKICYFRFFTCLASILADKIITISNSSYNDLSRKFKYASHKINVTYLGKGNSFNYSLNKEKVNFIKNKYGINKDYILFIGTIEPRKNINNLILAFDKFRNEYTNCQLVIAGKKGWHYDEIFDLIKKLSLNGEVIFTGFINEEEKPFLLAGAKIFAYPSIYEGFGIPVLEALACGIPTITSNVSSLPEVAGDAALLIDPLNIDELYLKIKSLFNNDNLYIELRTKSIEQAKKFSWQNTALETIKVYESLK